MKLSFKKLALLGLALTAMFVLVGCVENTTTTTTQSTSSQTSATLSDTQKVQAVLDGITLGDVTAVTANLTLPTASVNGVAISWSTEDADIVSATGEITIPDFVTGDQSVTLTLTATLNAVTLTKTFEVTVKSETAQVFLNRVGNSILITNPDAITANFKVPGTAQGATITWTSNNTDVATVSTTVDAEGLYTITVVRPLAEDGGVNTSVNLTASLTIGETTVQVVKNIRVLAEEPALPVATIAEALEEGVAAFVKIQGVTVMGKIGTGFFIYDGTDILYVYSTSVTPNIVVGNVYDVTGVVGYYYGAPQLAGAGSKVVKAVASTAAAKIVTPQVATIAEILANHPVPTEANPLEYKLYTVTGKVYIDTAFGNYSTYLFPESVDTSTTLITKPGDLYSYAAEALMIYYQSNLAAFSALHGKVVTVEILMYGYRTDRQVFYVNFLGALDDIEVQIEDDATAVEAALDTLVVPTTVTANTTVSLPAALFGVSLSYASSNATVVSPTTGLIDVSTVTTQISVTLTVTATRGTVTDTRDFIIKVGELPLVTIAEARILPDAAQVKVRGIVTAIVGSSAFIQDATGGLYLYNVGSANTSKLIIGNLLEVVGEVDIYNGFFEVKSFTVFEVISTGQTLPEAEVFNKVDLTAINAEQGSLVSMPILSIAEAFTVGTNGYSVRLTDGTTIIELRVDKYLGNLTAINEYMGTFAVGDEVKIVAIPVGAYNNPQFYITDVSQVIKLTEAEKLVADQEVLTIGLSNVSEGTQTLPLLGVGGSVITWTSNPNTAIINPTTGLITFPAVTVNTDFTLTATLTLGEFTAVTKDFVVSVRAMSSAEKVAADKAALTLGLTATEYDQATLTAIGVNLSTITWEVVSGHATIASGKVDYNFNEGVGYDAVLRATITNAEVVDTKEFTVVVSPVVFTSIADMYSTSVAIGQSVVIKGILTGQTTNSAFWIQDATTGLNIYVPSAMRTAFAAIPVGSEIILFGKKQIYNGLYEIEQLTKYIVLATVPALPTPADITEVAFNNTDLLPFQGELVSFQGFSLKAAPVADANGTYTFVLQEVSSGREISVRMDYRVPGYLAAKDQLLTFAVGDKIDVVGALLNWFNGYQLSIFTAAHIVDHVSTPAELAAEDVANLVVETSGIAGDTYTLPTTSGTSTITWALATTEHATLVDNVLTYANVTAAQSITVTATFSYPMGEAAPIVSTKDYVISIATLEAKLAADKAALTVADQLELSTLTLPVVGANGSTIAWALATTTDASLATNVLTLNLKGTAYTVTLTATLTLSTYTDTKEFVVNVNTITIITEFGPYVTQTAGAWTMPNAVGVYIKGVVTGFNGTNGIFVQDASGDALYVYTPAIVSLVAIGDEVIVYGNLVDYKTSYAIEYRFREIDTASLKSKLSTGNAVVVTTFTVAEIEAMNFYENLGKVMEVTGFVVSYDASNIYFNWKLVGDPAVQYTISFYDSLAPWLRSVYPAGSVLPAVQFTLTNISSSFTKVYGGNLVITMTDENAIVADSKKLPASLELVASYVLPTPTFGTAFAITAISAELTAYITNQGVVTLPETTDAVGTITISVTKGTATPLDVVIPVTIKAMTDAQKLADVLADLPATLALAYHYTIPTQYSAVFSGLVVPTELTGLVALSADASKLEIVRPAGTAPAIGTVTLTVTVGTATQNVDIAMTVMGLTDLFFSEYIEGGSNNKAFEIYNGTGASVDLSAYSVELYANGVSVPGTTVVLTGTLVDGDVYIIFNSGSVAGITSIGDLASTLTYYNGDDALVLKHNGVIIDVIGQVGTDPGTLWGTAGVNSTLNMTLVRKSTVHVGDVVASDPFDPSVEWDAYPQDTFTYLGSHTEAE